MAERCWLGSEASKASTYSKALLMLRRFSTFQDVCYLRVKTRAELLGVSGNCSLHMRRFNNCFVQPNARNRLSMCHGFSSCVLIGRRPAPVHALQNHAGEAQMHTAFYLSRHKENYVVKYS